MTEICFIKARSYRARTQTRTTRKNQTISLAICCSNRKQFSARKLQSALPIKAQSFTNMNYYNAQIIIYEDGLSVNCTILQYDAIYGELHHIADVVAYLEFRS